MIRQALPPSLCPSEDALGSACRQRVFRRHGLRRLRGSPSARAPTMNTRLRRCGTPKKRESRIRHATPYPRSASVPSTTPKSRPPLLLSSPGTFSTRTHPGRKASMTRANSWNSPERSPASPRRCPATETSWHGNPPARRSTCSGSTARRSSVQRRASVRSQRSAIAVECVPIDFTYVVVDGDSGPPGGEHIAAPRIRLTEEDVSKPSPVQSVVEAADP
jgi:hypothetical protein